MRRKTPYLLLAPGGAWLAAFYVVPALSMLSVSLQRGSLERGYRFAWRWQTYTEVLGTHHTQFTRSLVYGVFVTALCLAIGYPLAYAIAFRGGRWKNALLFAIILPFFVSFVIRTLSWRFILADQGFVLGPLKSLGLLPHGFHVLGTPAAVIGGLVYNFLPFMVLPLYVSLEKLDHSVLDAAHDLYSNRWSAFRHVTFPLSLPGILAGSLLTFIPAAGDYINASLLGGPNTTMIGNVIQREYLTNTNYPQASALSLILMVAILAMVGLYVRLLGPEELTG